MSGKLETHYEKQCLELFPNTTRLGTRPYLKVGFITTSSVSEKMDNILRNLSSSIVCSCLQIL